MSRRTAEAAVGVLVAPVLYAVEVWQRANDWTGRMDGKPHLEVLQSTRLGGAVMNLISRLTVQPGRDSSVCQPDYGEDA